MGKKLLEAEGVEHIFEPRLVTIGAVAVPMPGTLGFMVERAAPGTAATATTEARGAAADGKVQVGGPALVQPSRANMRPLIAASRGTERRISLS